MKMKPIYKYAAGLLACALAAACSDTDDFTPGDAVDPASPQAWFPLQETYNYSFTSADADKIILVNVSRSVAGEAVSVPVTLVSDMERAFTSAATIDFAAGESVSTLAIDCSGLPVKETHRVTALIAPELSNPYVNGCNEVSFSVVVSDWELWAPGAVFSFQNYYANVTSDIYAMPGTSYYKIVDFMGSGLDLPFELLPVQPGQTAQLLKPTYNADFFADSDPDNDWYGSWWFYDQAGGEWPMWSPDGVGEPQIEYMQADSHWEDSYYTFMDVSQRYGYFGFYLYYSDGTEGYENVSFTFGTPLFNMNY